MIEMNGKLDRLAEQLAVAQNHRYGRKSEKLDVIEWHLCFNLKETEELLDADAYKAFVESEEA